MAEEKEVEDEINDVIDIESFFSRDNEENGIWREVKYTGIEFKCHGPNSSKAAEADEYFRNEKAKLDENASDNKKLDELYIKRLAMLVSDVRGKNGKKLTLKGKDVTKNDIYTILFKSPVIATDLIGFVSRQENFLESE
ncbi:MAG: hypothetical protein KBT03_07540 [Bacteroidales bacterium]|nr:hypothetical protein [Candidatus Scybalousia scybalohippi]